MSSNSRRVRSTDFSATYAWKRSARISTSPALIGARSSRASARRRRRTTASTRASSSSGWQGFVSQSSAPIRRPRTRWATVDCDVHTTTPSPGRAAHSFSRYSHACGPSTARSITIAFRRIATTVSVGTGLASTRCSHPSRSRRLPSTWRNPESVSRTATRRCALPVAGAGLSSRPAAIGSVMSAGV
jgi:hypothetical protein